ncbi:allergen Asp F7 [Zalerion maritima]|uniref:Allergen Asp F7 n=1 Tax=Zalerion maritima TaxID=339359 RepID=A0AAD5WS94_9PEZI|nr:allergen Asp F7 [Zalerion maritima]
MFAKTALVSLLASIGLVVAGVAPVPRSTDYHGDATYYALGLGACGVDHSGKDNTANVVALSAQIMGTGPTLTDNPYCGRKVAIRAQGKSVDATVVDKCPGCPAGDLDVSEKIFKELFGDLGIGRGNIDWTLY